MIKSFKCDATEALFLRIAIEPAWHPFAKVALRKLSYLHAASNVQELRSPPGNRLEKLHGDRAGQWSIRINDQWRLCFTFEDGNAYHVEIVDYH